MHGYDDHLYPMVPSLGHCPSPPQMLAYLKDGAYLSHDLTKKVTAELLTYNRDTLVFGHWKGTFSWDTDGFITLTQKAHGLPAIDYTKWVEGQKYWQFIPDWIMVLFTCGYVIGSVWHIAKSVNAQQRIHDGDAMPPTHLTPEEAFQRQQRAKKVFKGRMRPFWVWYEAVIGALMLSALVCLYVYVFHWSPYAPISTSYEIYDADAYSPAHYFMLRKDESRFDPIRQQAVVSAASLLTTQELMEGGFDGSMVSSTSAFASPTLPAPGTPFRWALPDDVQPMKVGGPGG